MAGHFHPRKIHPAQSPHRHHFAHRLDHLSAYDINHHIVKPVKFCRPISLIFHVHFFGVHLRTVRIRLCILTGLLIPVSVWALSFADQSSDYADVSLFTQPESAGISVLTELGAVGGYANRTFRPSRVINRAEFLKIVLRSHFDSPVSDDDAAACFPDVGQWDWFSKYVCYAKKHGIIDGYPDGTFGPGNSVNYAEALKILGEMYGLIMPLSELPYDDSNHDRMPWYIPYREGAIAAGVSLEASLDGYMEHLLTRGEMARLAAAYRAHHDGQLAEYRAIERGESLLKSSSSSVSSQPSSSSISSASSVSSIARWTHPTTSHFLIVGKQSLPIASGLFQFTEPMDIRSVIVEMKRELRTIASLQLIDNRGRTLANLSLDKTDRERRRWRGENVAGVATVGPGSIPLGVAATIKTIAEGGFPEEFIEAKSMYLMVGDPAGIETVQSTPVEWSHPPHQTAMSTVSKVENAGPARGTLMIGTNQQVGEFRFFAGSGTPIHIEHLALTPKIGAEIIVQNWRVRRAAGGESITCSMGSDGFINCPLSESVGEITGGSLTLAIIADISKASSEDGGTLQVILDAAGSTSSFGAVQWSDGTGHYRWVEGEAPLAEGTGWAG